MAHCLVFDKDSDIPAILTSRLVVENKTSFELKTKPKKQPSCVNNMADARTSYTNAKMNTAYV